MYTDIRGKIVARGVGLVIFEGGDMSNFCLHAGEYTRKDSSERGGLSDI